MTTVKVVLLVLAIIAFSITIFCAFAVSSVSTPHLVGGLALGGALASASGLPA